MRESIEDRIIAYFDGRMTDGESAELLHRVSVSPEIRKLFREHEMLREVARSAQASTVVRPELEADLFSRIDALAAAEQAPVVAPIVEEKRRRVIPFFWSRRWRLGLATAVGAFVIGTAVALGPEIFDRNGLNAVDQQSTTDRLGASNGTDAPKIVTKDDIAKDNDLAVEAETPAKQDFEKVIRGDRDYEARQVRNERPALLGNRTDGTYTTYGSNRSQENAGGTNSVTNNSATTTSSAVDLASIAISAVSPKRELPINIGAEKGILPVFRAEDIEQAEASFEMAVETSSGFSYPADGPGVQPFADPRISVGYFLDRQNIVGVRFTSGLFQALPEISTTTNAAYTSISRNLEQERMNNYGVYYTRRVYGVLTDLMNLDASVGAGYIQSGGYTLTGELGLRLPFSSKLFGNISFALTRVHMNAASMDEITNSVSVVDGPVLIEGSDVQNTINGRIHYGLSYQF